MANSTYVLFLLYIFLPFEGWLKLGRFRGRALSNLTFRTALSRNGIEAACVAASVMMAKVFEGPVQRKKWRLIQLEKNLLVFYCDVFEEKQFHVECWWWWPGNEDLCKLLMLAAIERETQHSLSVSMVGTEELSSSLRSAAAGEGCRVALPVIELRCWTWLEEEKRIFLWV